MNTVNKFSAIFELRRMLREMEKDVGLADLTSTEWDVFLAAHSLTQHPGDVIESDEIRNHTLVSSLAQATYHRTLRALLKLGLLEKAEGCKAKSYIVRVDLAGG